MPVRWIGRTITLAATCGASLLACGGTGSKSSVSTDGGTKDAVTHADRTVPMPHADASLDAPRVEAAAPHGDALAAGDGPHDAPSRADSSPPDARVDAAPLDATVDARVDASPPDATVDARVDAAPPDATVETGPPCASPPCVLNAFLGTGQSLSQGATAIPLVSTYPVAPLTAFMTNLGVRPVVDDLVCVANSLDAGAITSLVPLEESVVGDDGETIASGAMSTIAAELLTEGRPQVDTFFSANGTGGQPYVCLGPGTQAYANLLSTATAAHTLWAPAGSGKSMVVRGVPITHGESDFIGLGTADVCDATRTTGAAYEADLVALAASLTTDLTQITGQTDPPMIFTDQMGSYTTSEYANDCVGNAATSDLTLAQLQVALDHPSQFVLVAPKYFLGYELGDGVHLHAVGEEQLGEKYGEAFFSTFFAEPKTPWKPLYITSATLSGATVTLHYAVPFPPIVLDATWVNATYTQPGVVDGFHYADDSASAPAVTGVAITDPTGEVAVTLAAPPTGTPGSRCIDYAWTGDLTCPAVTWCNPRNKAPGCDAGPICGARGNLHDSDPLTSRLQGGTGSYSAAISAASRFGCGSAFLQYTTAAPHEFYTGQVVQITGMTPEAYNTTAVIVTATATAVQPCPQGTSAGPLTVFTLGTNAPSDTPPATGFGVATVNNRLWNWAAQQRVCF